MFLSKHHQCILVREAMSPTVGTAALLIAFSNCPDFYPTVPFKRQIQSTWLNKSASLQVPVIQIGIFPFPPLET